jgi:hypothetical protein
MTYSSADPDSYPRTSGVNKLLRVKSIYSTMLCMEHNITIPEKQKITALA